MAQPTLDLGNANLSRLQELPQFGQQWIQRGENRRVVLHLISNLTASPETFARLEMMAKVGIATYQPIQLGQMGRTKTAGKTSSWQPQRLTNRPDTHSREALNDVVGPTQGSQRHGRQSSHQLRF